MEQDKGKKIDGKTITPPKAQEAHAPEPVDPSKVPGDYAIITESANQRRIFGVFHGTVKILPISALGGAFELK